MPYASTQTLARPKERPLERPVSDYIEDRFDTSPLILLVDDNPDDRERYARYLRKIEGTTYRYAEAEGFDSMRAQLMLRTADCILLDYSLPGQNGLDILREMAVSHPFLPVIMLTGQGNETIAVQSIKEGAQDYLVKSQLTPELLHQHIDCALRHCRLKREHAQLMEALRTSEDTFRALIEHASIGMGIVSPQGRWQRVNPALPRMLGYPQGVLLANDFQSLLHPDDRATALQEWEKVAGGKTANHHFECRFYGRKGRTVWAHVSLSMVRRPTGQSSFIVAQMEDVTQRREVERIKDEFISVVSHELRTPLTSIRGALGLLTGTIARTLPEKAQRLIQLASDNSERLILLINDILDIDKIASGHMRFDMAEHRVESLITQAVSANQPYADRCNITLSADPVPPELRICVDTMRFQQVLANLISNAAKFSPPGETVIVRVEVSETRVIVSVIDHGPGIPEEFQDRIFGKFSQADSSATRQGSGTGLGLHISQQLVHYMGGEIGFDTAAGIGTTFHISFPRLPDDA
ncbi:ATP-binding protein [Asticcacaulis sp. AND118]|uniref:ATP-binding response regulator n=1 Tax=Asticcacaulis sp. AND118 TaxID=2840468 RepID=UPI001CFF7C6F|nr:ATP-binding protein [Asticcacaulis sp. AND118]UDF03066.1 PAS domain S-box protein [Asticcacaulis sp. AND118]